MIWTINRLIQNFRTTRGVKFSKGTITHFATKLGYGLKRGGGLVGYDKSVYTALTRVFPDMVEYEKGNKIKKAQKAPKQPIDYNPDKFIEPDRADYEWEKNENRNNMKRKRLIEGAEVINNVDLACRIVRDQWSSPDDYWFLSITQREKDNRNVRDEKGNSIFASKGWDDGNEHENRIGYAVVMGNTVEEAIDSLLNPKVKIFSSVIRYVGKNEIYGNDGKMGCVIELCEKFNARAYMSQYKRSYKEFTNPNKLSIDRFTPSEIRALKGKTDDESLKRIFQYVNTHKPKPSRPFYLIDCDEEDSEIQQKILAKLNELGIDVAYTYQTHAGVHYLVDLSTVGKNASGMRAIFKELNAYFRSLYGKEAEVGDHLGQTNPVEIERDKSIIVYSGVKAEGKNVTNPEWQKGLNFRANVTNENKNFIKNIVRNVIKEFINREINVI